MREQPEEIVAPHLIEVLDNLDDDLDRIELWTAALSCFQHPPPTTSPTTSCLTNGRNHSERA